jgi:hypothetical protein
MVEASNRLQFQVGYEELYSKEKAFFLVFEKLILLNYRLFPDSMRKL